MKFLMPGIAAACSCHVPLLASRRSGQAPQPMIPSAIAPVATNSRIGPQLRRSATLTGAAMRRPPPPLPPPADARLAAVFVADLREKTEGLDSMTSVVVVRELLAGALLTAVAALAGAAFADAALAGVALAAPEPAVRAEPFPAVRAEPFAAVRAAAAPLPALPFSRGIAFLTGRTPPTG